MSAHCAHLAYLLLLGAAMCAVAQDLVTPQTVAAIASNGNPLLSGSFQGSATAQPPAIGSDVAAAALAASLGRRGMPGVLPTSTPTAQLTQPPFPEDFIAPPNFPQSRCIDDPQEFAEVFNTATRDGQQARCVSDDIIVRINQDFLNVTAAKRLSISKSVVEGLARATSFWSYGDNPEKYLRIGRDNLVLGNYVDNPKISNGLGDATFAGIKSMSNFAALLEAVGYGSSSTNPKLAYMMVITKKPSTQVAAVYEPTWQNVTKYFTYYVTQIAAADPTALEAAGFKSRQQFQAFSIEPEVAQYLSKTSFADLTGCPAQCTYQDTRYGAIGGADGPNWLAPTKDGSRRNSSDSTPLACDKPVPTGHPSEYGTVWKPEDLVLTEPTIIDDRAASCTNTVYQYYQRVFKGKCQTPGSTNITENRALGLIMADTYMREGKDLATKVAIFRSYLTLGCGGSFNQLFSGDGFTYTGNGGFLGATGTEVHVGQVPSQRMPIVFPRVRLVYFCPVAPDGTPNAHAICPASLGSFNKEDLMKLYNITGVWDIEEVRHPDDVA